MKNIFIIIFLASLLFSPKIISAQVKPFNPPIAKKNINFCVRWDGKIIPGITKISGLQRKTEIVENRSGGDPSMMRRSPGKTEYKPIVMKRSLSSDKEFENWANKVWNLGSGAGLEVSLKDFRKDIIIELLDDTGKILMAFNVYRCWPSEYVALSDLDGGDRSFPMEILVLENEGWERNDEIQ